MTKIVLAIGLQSLLFSSEIKINYEKFAMKLLNNTAYVIKICYEYY